ncbi:MAG: hypothetical protein KAJ19_16940 [Gammaproteobacteria bacterium]|nr:hypothetical protein [Gammaproteobacteria bacterium]
MGLKQEVKMICGHEWTVNQFPARAANRYKARIIKMVGPAITELLPALGSIGAVLKGEIDEMAMIAAIPKLASQLARHVDEDVLVDTMVDLMATSVRKDDRGIQESVTPEAFDIIFAGNDLELYQALWFILEVNYADFIGWVRGQVTGRSLEASPRETPEKPQPAPETSK